jgi:hypothetical protein
MARLELNLHKLARTLALWRQTRLGNAPALQVGLWGRDRIIRDTIRAAHARGYRAGEHCQGGAYAVSAAGLAALGTQGMLDDPCVWLRTPVPEDHTMALCIRAAGLHPGNLGGTGGLIASHWQGLPAAPAELERRGAAIIHSVKDYAGRTEAGTREYFRNRRHGRS